MRPQLRNRSPHLPSRVSPRLTSWVTSVVAFLCLFYSSALAQHSAPQSSEPQYPEIAWLTGSTYCNPYFGFRLALPSELKAEAIHLPVQPHGRHQLLAMHLQRLDRSADLLISAFPDSSDHPARLAAKARAQQAHSKNLSTSGPRSLSVHEHEFFHLHVVNDTQAIGNESSYFFALRGYVLHIAIFSHEPDLSAALDAAVEHQLEFIEPGNSACTVPLSIATAPGSVPQAARLYYGPALPTALVEATLRNSPGNSIPSGDFSRATFTDPALGIRVVLPPGWQPLPNQEAYRATELMRDPTTDTESADRRRALFRACARVLFTASEPRTELISQVHPTLAVAAVRQGCIPDMIPPATVADHAAAEDYATVLVRSLGVPLLGHGSALTNSAGRMTFNLDGTLPYQLPDEKLARRLSLRVSATASGPWLIFVYSVTATPSVQRELESHIAIGLPAASSAK